MTRLTGAYRKRFPGLSDTNGFRPSVLVIVPRPSPTKAPASTSQVQHSVQHSGFLPGSVLPEQLFSGFSNACCLSLWTSVLC